MLLVVCPNLAIDRILEVDNFQSNRVQRSRSVSTQAGGKGSNVARVFRQLGGDVVLVGFVGAANGEVIREPLRRLGIHVDFVTAYEGESRTCTIVCDSRSKSHPTVINEESPAIDKGAAAKLLAKIGRWIPRVDAVLTTGSLSTGLPEHFYADILDHARSRGKVTAIDAAGTVLRNALLAHPTFIKPNAEEFSEVTRGTTASSVLMLAPHTALTFGRTGAVIIRDEKCLYAAPPRIFDINPIGTGDSFAAGYLKKLLERQPVENCLRSAVAAAACDAATLRPGFIQIAQYRSLSSQVELRFF
jgi:1-phosphofructokinase family hexose kinase